MTMSHPTIDELMALPYHRVVTADPEGTYSARVIEFDGCLSGGQSASEAITNLDEAMRLWLEGEIEQGHAIPQPYGSTEYSGRINLRLASSLHEQAALRAEIEGISLNQLFVTAIANYLGWAARPHTYLQMHPSGSTAYGFSPMTVVTYETHDTSAMKYAAPLYWQMTYEPRAGVLPREQGDRLQQIAVRAMGVGHA